MPQSDYHKVNIVRHLTAEGNLIQSQQVAQDICETIWLCEGSEYVRNEMSPYQRCYEYPGEGLQRDLNRKLRHHWMMMEEIRRGRRTYKLRDCEESVRPVH